MSQIKTVLVLAGSYEQFYEYVKEVSQEVGERNTNVYIDNTHYVYIDSVSQTFGYEADGVIAVGTFWTTTKDPARLYSAAMHMKRILNKQKGILSEGQQKVLDFIISYMREQGVAPTQEEIAAHIESTRQNAKKYLDTLAAKGWIKKEGRGYRNIEVQKLSTV